MEEIEDLEGSSDFLISDAIVSENINLTAEQRKNYKKVCISEGYFYECQFVNIFTLIESSILCFT